MILLQNVLITNGRIYACVRAFADGCGAFGERRGGRRRAPLERGARRGAGVSKGGTSPAVVPSQSQAPSLKKPRVESRSSTMVPSFNVCSTFVCGEKDLAMLLPI
jgi:hypothetical protein